MDFSPLVDRIAGEGAAAWKIHTAALEAQARGEDVIVLSVGDPDLDTPAAVTNAAVSALTAGDTHYMPVEGTPELRQAISRDFARRSGVPVGAENVCVTAGAQNALFFASLLLFRPDDEVLVPDPCYVTYEATVRAAGAASVPVPPLENGGFRPDLDALAARLTPTTRAILLTTPNNPTGVVMSRGELDEVARLARENDLWVVSDEVYGGLTYDVPHYSIAALPGMAERTLTVSSLSKSHAMTGWRCGWLIGPERAIEHAGNLALCMLYGLPGFVQQAGVVALSQADRTLEQMRGIYRHRRDSLLAALADVPGFRALVPEAGMFLMVDIRESGLTANEFAWTLFRETGVSVLDATAFGPSTAGHVRLSFTLGDGQLEEAARRIRAFCATRVPATV